MTIITVLFFCFIILSLIHYVAILPDPYSNSIPIRMLTLFLGFWIGLIVFGMFSINFLIYFAVIILGWTVFYLLTIFEVTSKRQRNNLRLY